MLPGTQFEPKIEIEDPFEASGTIETRYGTVVQMFVGLLQVRHDPVSGERSIKAAAYGKGVPAMYDTRSGNGQQGWSMYLQRDADPEKSSFEAGAATGFVVVELAGGQFTGWIDDGVELVKKGAGDVNP